MKLSKKQFALFQQECQRLTKAWHLNWRVDVSLGGASDGALASVCHDAETRTSSIWVAKYWEHENPITHQKVLGVARHEMLHVLNAPVEVLADKCEVLGLSKATIGCAEHDVLRRLELVLWGKCQ